MLNQFFIYFHVFFYQLSYTFMYLKKKTYIHASTKMKKTYTVCCLHGSI